jgi:hypothetical protein
MLGDVEAATEAAQEQLISALRAVGGGDEAPAFARMLASETWAWGRRTGR